jgi:hypothetical protein
VTNYNTESPNFYGITNLPPISKVNGIDLRQVKTCIFNPLHRYYLTHMDWKKDSISHNFKNAESIDTLIWEGPPRENISHFIGGISVEFSRNKIVVAITARHLQQLKYILIENFYGGGVQTYKRPNKNIIRILRNSDENSDEINFSIDPLSSNIRTFFCFDIPDDFYQARIKINLPILDEFPKHYEIFTKYYHILHHYNHFHKVKHELTSDSRVRSKALVASDIYTFNNIGINYVQMLSRDNFNKYFERFNIEQLKRTHEVIGNIISSYRQNDTVFLRPALNQIGKILNKRIGGYEDFISVA